MCMRPCGPVRHHYSSDRKGTVMNYSFKYWTDSYKCNGQQVGGSFKCLLSNNEVTKLKEIATKVGRDYESIKKNASEIFVKMEQAAYKALEFKMSEEVYGEFDFSDSKFRGWKRDRKIRYIMSTAEEPASALFSIGFELPESFSTK